MSTDWKVRAELIKSGKKRFRVPDDEERPTYRDQHEHWFPKKAGLEQKIRCKICGASELDLWFEKQGELG